MKIYVNIEPVFVTGRNKTELLHNIHSRFNTLFYTCSSLGTGLSDGHRFIVYNAQKFRRKRGVRTKNYWEAYVYVFDKKFLHFTDLSVIQGTRTFRIKQK